MLGIRAETHFEVTVWGLCGRETFCRWAEHRHEPDTGQGQSTTETTCPVNPERSRDAGLHVCVS